MHAPGFKYSVLLKCQFSPILFIDSTKSQTQQLFCGHTHAESKMYMEKAKALFVNNSGGQS